MDGEIDFLDGDIYTLLQIVFENTGPTAATEPWMKALAKLRILFRRFQQMNTIARSSDNIKSHYDLSGELYDLFLDPDKQYSCAYFETPNATLAEAQLAKKRHIAAKLLVKEGQKVLDIGCGWGGMGLYLARHLKADVTGVTLSEEQHGIANQRAVDEGLSDRAKFELTDYRNIDDKFDRLVSVGMFEHVGVGHFAEYFQHVARLMKPDGVFLLHAIGRADGPGATNPFIRKYIFPGGYIPALSEVLPHIEKAGLYVTDIEILRLHYAETLKAWREAFMANRAQAKALYDERFCRMWEFYLAASESAFRWQNMMVFHIQIAHRQESVPLTRNYIEAEEKRLKRLDSAPKGANSEARAVKKSMNA
jgi:cyclopropane-fatty-acyl-phospholipid synthase